MKKKLPNPGEIYIYYIEELKKYGACQIVKVENESVCYVSLDCLTDYLPEREEISDWKPLYLESFRNHHSMDIFWIYKKPFPPSHFKCLGEFPLVTEKSANSFTGGWPDGSSYIHENRWKSFGEEATAAYKKYVNSGEDVCIHGKRFPKRTSGLTDELYSCLNEQDSLKQFPCISFARVNGFSEKLLKLIKTSPLLATLYLENSGVSVLDLRGTGLDNLELDMTRVKKLYLPERVHRIVLDGNIERGLIIDDSACDENNQSVFMRISLKKTLISHFGMERLHIKKLVLHDIMEIDAAGIVKCFLDLKELRLVGCPGIIKNVQMLGQLEKLQILSLEDIFGFGMEFLKGIEQMPLLRELDCENIPKDVGAEIKKQWKGKLDNLSVTKLRNEEWLKENMNNPLRHWDGSEFIPQAAYKKAFQCYKNTKKQLLEAASRQDVMHIAQTYTEQFNKLNDKYEEFIETEEREDIFAAMKQLYEDCVIKRFSEKDIGSANRLNVTLEEIYDAMEEVRGDW